ncbi:MAG: dihydrodipicolinate synthase family protein [Acidobacteria bacterium]|nr:dihydrodipicolinate synthase family protein [Acidobacteriota bacterium]MCI0721704.1 dihydrodipicolinate synthase family protein [Acidobacteriota bacterium]
MLTIQLIRETLLSGCVIPAHPLALNENRRLDERRQTALTRYYCDAGAGGVAVGVHTTQFAIHDAKTGLLEPVLRLAADAVRACEHKTGRTLIKVAGICGLTDQALREAGLARELGYDAGLVSLSALRAASTPEILEHCRMIADVLPVFGFYLQPAVGGRLLDYDFWRGFLEIGNVVAIKIAPFNRYHTLDVVRALAASGRPGEVALYTGNDDNIIGDLLADFPLDPDSSSPPIRFSGGLLGQWAVWTGRAVELLEAVSQCRDQAHGKALELLALSNQLTDANAALFDVRHAFAGCIAGLHEILRRQGLLEGRWCLDPHEELSPGQMEEIDRVCKSYPHLQDDAFVQRRLDQWLS